MNLFLFNPVAQTDLNALDSKSYRKKKDKPQLKIVGWGERSDAQPANSRHQFKSTKTVKHLFATAFSKRPSGSIVASSVSMNMFVYKLSQKKKITPAGKA